jgi:hypothetical protein
MRLAVNRSRWESCSTQQHPVNAYSVVAGPLSYQRSPSRLMGGAMSSTPGMPRSSGTTRSADVGTAVDANSAAGEATDQRKRHVLDARWTRSEPGLPGYPHASELRTLSLISRLDGCDPLPKVVPPSTGIAGL